METIKEEDMAKTARESKIHGKKRIFEINDQLAHPRRSSHAKTVNLLPKPIRLLQNEVCFDPRYFT
jgi:hypothetical protein